MARSLKTAALLVSFTLAASMASANNFSKSVKSEPAEGDAVKTETPAVTVKAETTPVIVKTAVNVASEAKTEVAPPVKAAAKVEAPVVKVEIPAVKVEAPAAKVETPVVAPKPAPAKPQAPAKSEPSSKPASDKPYEIQTFDRTMVVCPDGYACAGGNGADYKCVPDKTKSEAGHGEVCKTTPREQPKTTEPANKAGQKK